MCVYAQEYRFVSIEHLIEQEVSNIIIKEVYKDLGIDVSITPYPAIRAEKKAVSGEMDGEICRIYSFGNNKPSLIRVPTSYYYVESMGFVNKDSGIVVNSRIDLKNYSVGVIRGVKISQEMTEGVSEVHEVKNTESLIKMLNSGRIDIALTNTIDGNIMIQKLGLEDAITTIQTPLVTMDLFHYIHENNLDIVYKVNEKILEMKNNGELEVLIKSAEQIVMNRILGTNL